MSWCGNQPALSAVAQNANWQQALGDIIISLGEISSDYRLGIVYVSRAFTSNLGDIEILLRQSTGVRDWVGTAGYGVLGTGREYYDEPAISVLLLPIEAKSYQIFADIQTDTGPALSRLSPWLKDRQTPLIVTHADPANPMIDGLIKDLADKTEGYLVGGLSAAQGDASQLARAPSGQGLSGVFIDSQIISTQTALSQGCSPIGPVHQITKRVENILIQLDGRPALAVFKEDIGDLLARDLAQVAGYIFAALPVQGSDQQDYLVRNLTGIDRNHGALAVAANLQKESQILFCRRDHDSAVLDMKRMLADLKKRVGNSPIRAGIYISCAARGPNQFSQNEQETGMIQDMLGDFPLTGFFANGEISHDRLYGYTGILTVFL